MTWLILGLLLWTGAHLFKRICPERREALGKKGRPLIAVAVVASVVFIIIGYRQAEQTSLYALPIWAWYLNNGLMLIALFLMDAGRVKGLARTYIRHPMLTGVVTWSIAHLLVNGDTTSLILFGGLGIWALVQMAVINHAEGPWQVPEKGSITRDALVALIAVALYVLIVGIHYWLGRPVLMFN